MDLQPEMRDILMRNGLQAHIAFDGGGYKLIVQGHDSPLLTYPITEKQLLALTDWGTNTANKKAYNVLTSILAKDFYLPKNFVHARNANGRVAMGLHGYLTMAASHNAADNTATSYSLLDIASTLAWGLGYFGMPHILLRFMAIEDEKKLVLSRRIASVWVVIAMTASIVIGMVGLGMTKAGALEFLSGSSSETLIVRVASLIAQHGVLAAILAGLILAGILAATMSTADSQMLAAASSVSQNILQEFGHMKLTEKQSLFAARLTIICISVVGVVLARDPNSSVFGIVSFAWAGFGGSFGAVVLCSLFWKRCNWQGALAGMLSGGLMVFVWKYIISPLGGVFGIYELLPAFLISLVVCVVVSLVTPAPSAEIEAEFDAAK